MDELKKLLYRFWKADDFFSKASDDEVEKQIGNYEKLILAIRDTVNALNLSHAEFRELIENARISHKKGGIG